MKWLYYSKSSKRNNKRKKQTFKKVSKLAVTWFLSGDKTQREKRTESNDSTTTNKIRALPDRIGRKTNVLLNTLTPFKECRVTWLIIEEATTIWYSLFNNLIQINDHSYFDLSSFITNPVKTQGMTW